MTKKKKSTKPVKLEKWKSTSDKQVAPPPAPLPPDERIGYAIVGLGHLALEEVIPELMACKFSRLAALVSSDEEKMEKVALQYGVKPEACYTYDNYDDLKDNDDVKVIYIILPNDMHKEFTIRGAKAGKHILCEKPMANSAAECRQMIKACKKAGVKLMIAYRIQYQPHNLKLKELIKNEQFGKVKYVEAANGQSSANPEHWRHVGAQAGGGALPDIGIYCLNTTRFLLDAEPTEVFAYKYSTPGDPLFKDTEELISWQMKFKDGIIASCMAHYKVHEVKTLRVHAEHGWMFMDKAFAYAGQQLTTARAEGEMSIQENIGLAETKQFAVEMDHFSQCILNDKESDTPGEEGLQDHIIMEAIYKSAETGKPVKIKY
ncbi:Gfo/Idh/MocA family protein [Pedobacter metabolipauper]|uniref:Putative dehydrogenase n=1 Tax=Pedobacter metabolipauper TaxID=425513 RepID=A0A4R6SY73_9SPHI|nr:Gfo/Idh/MocA family oxidoreductase [Pedobacter metabolipauper]TDQ11504.1 putative dehydrogenase [Pedobacter metabolipauper]